MTKWARQIEAKQQSKDVDQHDVGCTLWGHDLVYGQRDDTLTGWIQTEVGKNFAIGDCADLTWFLGIYSQVSADRLSLSHSRCIKIVFKKFEMESCKPFSTPLAE